MQLDEDGITRMTVVSDVSVFAHSKDSKTWWWEKKSPYALGAADCHRNFAGALETADETFTIGDYLRAMLSAFPEVATIRHPPHPNRVP